MQTSIDENRTAIADLCRRFRVERLEVFGAAARGEGLGIRLGLANLKS